MKKKYITQRLGFLKKELRKNKKPKRDKNNKYTEKFCAHIPIIEGSEKTKFWCMRLKIKERTNYLV
jgi:hypothetical protein